MNDWLNIKIMILFVAIEKLDWDRSMLLGVKYFY